MSKCSTKNQKVYVGFDVSEKKIEIFSVCGTKTSRRFKTSARLCAYLGLVPKQDQSGNTDKQLGITKKGNKLGRRLLIQAAHYIMGPFGTESRLRSFGLRIQSRGGNSAKMKSFVAVARKLVTVMFALWMHPEIPYKHNFKKGNKAAA